MLRVTLFFGVLLVLVGGLHLFVYRRVRATFDPPRPVARGFAALLVSGPLALVLGRVATATLPPGVLEGVAPSLGVYGAIVTIGALLAAAMLLPVVGLERLAGFAAFLTRRKATPLDRAAATPGRSAPAHAEPSSTEDTKGALPRHSWLEGAVVLPRRRFLGQATTGAALCVAGGSGLYGGLVGRRDFQLDEVPIVLPRLPPTLDGYTIVQLSDIHFGTYVGEPEIRIAEELVRRARPNLVVLTGDLVDHDPRYAPLLGQLVRRLEPLARDGVIAVPGNHDYYTGVEAVLGTLREAGARVLFNAGRVVGDQGGAFALLGVDDVWAARGGRGGPDLDRALAMVPPDLPRVLLCHNPELYPEVADRVDLQLSGHTHGGQVNFGVNSAGLVLPHDYVRGHYRRGESQIYVNRGFGTAGPPTRLFSPPEVTKLVLVAG